MQVQMAPASPHDTSGGSEFKIKKVCVAALPHIFCVYVSKRVNEREKSAKPRVFIGEIAKTGGVNGRALEAPDWWIAG